MSMKWKRIALLAMLVTTVCVTMSALAEEIVSRKLTVIQVEGTEAHIKKPNGAKVKAVKGMSLGQENKVMTGKDTYVYISADDDKTFRLDERSTIAIRKASSKSLEVEIQDGKVFFNVDKPLAEDEDMSFKVAHTSMSIRGTSGWFNYSDMNMDFFLVEGAVDWDIDGQPVAVRAGERVTLERDWQGLEPGPGRPLIYCFTSRTPYTWSDMPEDALIAVMENRASIDLAAIGLDTPEKIAEAAAKVEEIVKEREKAKKPAYDDDDDWGWVNTTPTTKTPATSEAPSPTQPTTASSSNAAPTTAAQEPEAGDDSGDDVGQNPGNDSGDGSGEGSGEELGGNLGEGSGDDSGQESGSNSETDSTSEPETEPETENETTEVETTES